MLVTCDSPARDVVSAEEGEEGGAGGGGGQGQQQQEPEQGAVTGDLVQVLGSSPHVYRCRCRGRCRRRCWLVWCSVPTPRASPCNNTTFRNPRSARHRAAGEPGLGCRTESSKTSRLEKQEIEHRCCAFM